MATRDKRRYKRTNNRTSNQTDKRTNERTNGRTNKRMNGQTSEQTDGRIDGWINGYTRKHAVAHPHTHARLHVRAHSCTRALVHARTHAVAWRSCLCGCGHWPLNPWKLSHHNRHCSACREFPGALVGGLCRMMLSSLNRIPRLELAQQTIARLGKHAAWRTAAH